MHSHVISTGYAKEVGSLLKAARQQRSLEVAEIAIKIALSPSQLRLLEEGETAAFYNHHFYLQATRRYGEFLGIELPSPPLQSQDATPIEAPEQPPAPSQPTYRLVSNKVLLAGVASIGAIAIIGVFMITQPGQNVNKTAMNTASVVPPQEAPAPRPTNNPDSASESASAPTSVSAPASASAPAPAATSAPAAAPPSPEVKNASSASSAAGPTTADSSLVNQDPTWVQIISKDGIKTNLRTQAGEIVQFHAKSTAAVAFGKPSTAKLTINGREVKIENFLVEQSSTPRALVILKDL